MLGEEVATGNRGVNTWLGNDGRYMLAKLLAKHDFVGLVPHERQSVCRLARSTPGSKSLSVGQRKEKNGEVKICLPPPNRVVFVYID